ncbi:hypothetical protein D3C78_1088840 [compost metagenome]
MITGIGIALAFNVKEDDPVDNLLDDTVVLLIERTYAVYATPFLISSPDVSRVLELKVPVKEVLLPVLFTTVYDWLDALFAVDRLKLLTSLVFTINTR